MQKGFVLEFLRRGIGDLDRARSDARARAILLLLREGRVNRNDVADPPLAQHVELVFHQCDQRADDDRRTFEHQRGQLIGQALSGAGSQNCQRILAYQDPGYDLFLAWVEFFGTRNSLAATRAGPRRSSRPSFSVGNSEIAGASMRLPQHMT